MLRYNEIKQGAYIVFDNQPYEVIYSNVFRKQANKPVNQTKLKNLINKKVIEKSFHQSEKVAEADITTREIKYLYNNRGEFWFSEKDDPKTRFNIAENIIGSSLKFIKESSVVESLVFNIDGKEKIIGIKTPIKVELKVTEAPPNVKGNTAQGGTKPVTLETGAVVTVPMFINAGDIIRINTGTGEYAERVKK